LGGIATARAVNRELVGSVDVLLGNEEDLAAALGYEVEGLGPNLTDLDPANFARMIDRVVEDYPNLRVVATTLRGVTSASRNDWGRSFGPTGPSTRPLVFIETENTLDRRNRRAVQAVTTGAIGYGTRTSPAAGVTR
jgi:hypothetical protein